MRNNQLKELPMELPLGLRKLDISHNQISHIPSSLFNLKNLTVVDARGNPIEPTLKNKLHTFYPIFQS